MGDLAPGHCGLVQLGLDGLLGAATAVARLQGWHHSSVIFVRLPVEKGEQNVLQFE